MITTTDRNGAAKAGICSTENRAKLHKWDQYLWMNNRPWFYA